MFEYLQQIDNAIYDRYLTVEKNIKAASNSFYDAFLDLQEDFLKAVAAENSIDIDKHESCGALLKRPEVKELFLSKYNLDEKVYEKMGDYTKKTNEHKHEKEKNIEAETVANYMHVFYKASSCYAIFKGLTVPQFNRNDFINIFGSVARIDKRLEELEEGQQKILQAIGLNQQAQANREEPKPAPVRHNDTQALRNFILNADKKYLWFGTKKDFKKSKIILAVVQLVMIAVGILSTIISSICFDMYSTFTLFENIVAIQVLILLTYTLKSKKLYIDSEYATHTSDIFVQDGDNIWRDTNREKKRYKWMRRISYVAIILNIICIWIMGSGSIRIYATIFEVAYLALTVATVYVSINHYCMYGDLFISGFTGGKKVTIVHDSRENKLYTLDDYSRKFPSFV